MAVKINQKTANIGTSTMIVIFTVLCLVTFSVLSLGSARNDSLLSKRNAEAVKAFYAADSAAEDFYMMVDRTLKNSKGITPWQVQEEVSEALSEFYYAEFDTIYTEFPMPAGQALYIELIPNWEDRTLSIQTWQVYNTEDYEIDQSMQVWSGE